MKSTLEDLFEGHILTSDQASDILHHIVANKYPTPQVASFLTIFRMRNITAEEMIGFRRTMLSLCLPVPIEEYSPIDLCGTGGDGKDTYNISTVSSFVVAGAGIPVAKHGNKAVSSHCGSSNVLEHLGCRFTNDISLIKQSLDKANICYLHAPLFHPAMKKVAPIRAELGFKTFFNLLGPMVNPAHVQHQIIGVYSPKIATLYNEIYKKTDACYTIVHSTDGYDEISLTGGFDLYKSGGVHTYHPADVGLSTHSESSLSGGHTLEESASIFISILENKGTIAQTETTLANAGLAIATYKDIELKKGISLARESIESGAAYQSFREFKRIHS